MAVNYHPLCRPPKALLKAKIWRLSSKGWRRDNGDPGLAFVYLNEEEDATVWVANCRCVEFRACPVARALAKASDLGCIAATVDRRRASPRTRKR